jgi:uncharacterized protein YaiE (UPF0345 family)
MEHNIYFDGAIQSIGFDSDEGEATIGAVKPGTYTMPTDCVEHITMLSGSGRVKIGDAAWRGFAKGDSFVLPADVDVVWEVSPGADGCYICHFK